MSLKVVTDYIPIGHPNRPGIKLSTVKARVWHGTSNLNAGAGDEAHRKYVGRAYVKQWNKSLGKYEYFEGDGKTAFRMGAAHVYIDRDSATIMIPLDEVVWGCGDRPNDYNNGYKGQTKTARDLFAYRQNYETIQFELCMNDMAAWEQVLKNAVEFTKQYCPEAGIENYRHYDITGKSCPSPFLDGKSKTSWEGFRQMIRSAISPNPLADAVKVLQGNGIISAPEYWLENAKAGMTIKGDYAAALIIKTANTLKSGL